MDSILQIGNSLYCYLHALTSKNHLLVSELPSTLLFNGETCRLFYGESISGYVNIRESRDCFFFQFEALRYVNIGYSACLLTVFCYTIAIFFGNNILKVFDAHSRDIYGNVSVEGTSVLLEFSGLEELICYLKDFYSDRSPTPFEATGVNVVCFALFTCSQNYGAENVVTVIDGVEEVRIEKRHEESGVALNGIELCTARENGIYRQRKDKLEKQMENKSKENYVEIKKIETRE